MHFPFHKKNIHPSFSAVCVAMHAFAQIYHYQLDTGIAHDPLRARYSHHLRKPLDLDAMRAGAALLVGRHDFTQFSNNSPERLRRNPVKTLERLDIIEDGPAAVRLEVRLCCFS
jgi:tRNA pseudouridine38-40 synthase